jgi:hypothetical protein
MKFLGLALVFFAAGCNNGPGNIDQLVGSYAITVSMGTPNDPDTVSIEKGVGGTLLFSFNSGFYPDPEGQSPLGFRTMLDGTKLTMMTQNGSVDTAFGPADGKMSGTGTLPLDGSTVSLDLVFTPTTAIYDANGMQIPPGTMLMYHCEGTKD